MSLAKWRARTREAWLLARELGRQTNKHWMVVLGDMFYYWTRARINLTNYTQYDFARKSAVQKKEYLSNRILNRWQYKLVRRDCLNLVDNKLCFYDRCLRCSISTPKIFAYIPAQGHNHIAVINGVSIINNTTALRHLFARLQPRDLILKTIDGRHGAGLIMFELRDGILRDKRGNIWSSEDLLRYCQRTGINAYDNRSAGFLVQEYLEAADVLKPIMPGPGLGTLRMITFMNRNFIPDIVYSFLKVPAKDSLSDNFDHGNTGNMLVSIDLKTGFLQEGWGKLSGFSSLSKLNFHPDTGIEFNKIHIPCWSEVKMLVKQAAQSFSEFKTIGWDIAVSNRGIYILEANWRYDAGGTQITLQRGIKSEMKQLFSQYG